MKLIFTLLFAFTLIVNVSAQLKNTDFKEPLRMINAWLEGQRDFDRLPGISVAIVNDQEIIFSKGYGFADVEKKVPMQAETIGSICSISKLFTSVAVMSLWEQGKLRLDDSINALLPFYNLKQNYTESVPVTIRALLTHSSGLPREAAYAYWSEPDFYFPTEEEIKVKLSSQQTLYPASTYFQYSNLGIALLGEVVAKVTGMAYNTYVDKTILQPLQLQSTKPFLPKDLWGSKMATGYSSLYRDGTRKRMPFFQANGIASAAGFSSSVLDLARFASWQLRLLKDSGKSEILRPSTLKEMQRVQWMNTDRKSAWGLGFALYQNKGNNYVGHGGSCPGYLSSLSLSPKNKMAVAVMINAQGIDVGKYTTGIFDIMEKAKGNMDTTSKNIDLEIYAGHYDAYAWGGEDVVMPWKGKLAVFNLPSDNPAESMELFKYVGADTFRRIRKDDDTLGEELRFERDSSGKVVRMYQHNNYEKKLK